MAKRALLCGCNYPGTKSSLRGCVNDCLTMKELLTEHFGFDEGNITLMLDTNSSTTQPTGANIKAKLAQIVAASRPGDALFFHFSGHGTQVPDDEEPDGKDECICPTDMNIICDDDLRAIFAPLDPSVKLTVVCDCCHSGTLLDHSAVAISGPKAGESVPNLSSMLSSLLLGSRDLESCPAVKNRSLPTHDFLDMLSSKLGTNVQTGNIRNSLVSLFGKQSSNKAINYSQLAGQAQQAMASLKKGDYKAALPFAKSLYGAFKGHSSSSDSGSAAPTHAPAGGGGGGERLGADVGILITGCQSHETSADACPSGDPNQAFGALSNAIKAVLTAHFQQNPGGAISYRTLVTGVREALAKSGFSQNPCLECSPHNADTNFILP